MHVCLTLCVSVVCLTVCVVVIACHEQISISCRPKADKLATFLFFITNLHIFHDFNMECSFSIGFSPPWSWNGCLFPTFRHSHHSNERRELWSTSTRAVACDFASNDLLLRPSALLFDDASLISPLRSSRSSPSAWRPHSPSLEIQHNTNELAALKCVTAQIAELPRSETQGQRWFEFPSHGQFRALWVQLVVLSHRLLAFVNHLDIQSRRGDIIWLPLRGLWLLLPLVRACLQTSPNHIVSTASETVARFFF